MSHSAAALTIIQDHLSVYGDKLPLGQVLANGGDEIAGLGFDRATDVRVEGLDARVFPEGVLAGRLACRAVLLEPGVSERFVGEPGVEGAIYLRTRLEYDEPGIGSLPNPSKALTIGGRVTHVAVHNLLPGDGASLDEYYAELAAYEEGSTSSSGQTDRTHQNRPPEMPPLRTHYGLHIPGVPNFNKGVDTTPRAERRLELRRMGFGALQAAYPAARVLSASTQGYVSRDELTACATAFTEAA